MARKDRRNNLQAIVRVEITCVEVRVDVISRIGTTESFGKAIVETVIGGLLYLIKDIVILEQNLMETIRGSSIDKIDVKSIICLATQRL